MLQALAEVCAVCNEATVECKAGTFKALGAPTEAALVVLAEKLGVPDANEQHRLRQQRSNDPENNATPACQWYSSKCVLPDCVVCLTESITCSKHAGGSCHHCDASTWVVSQFVL